MAGIVTGYYVTTWTATAGTVDSTMNLAGIRAELAACRKLGGSLEISRPEWDGGTLWSYDDQNCCGWRGWEGRPFHPGAVALARALGWD